MIVASFFSHRLFSRPLLPVKTFVPSVMLALVAAPVFPSSAASTITALGDLPGGSVSSSAYGVSNDGQVVVGQSSSTVSSTGEAFKWTPSGGMVGLGLLPGGSTSYARAVSRDGTTITGDANSTAAQPSGGTEAFIYTNGVMSGLHTPFIMYQGMALNSNGTLVVSGNSSQHWTPATGVVYNTMPYTSRGVSDDGSVVVGWSSGFHAQRWTAATGVVNLPDNSASSSQAYGVSGNGKIAVGVRGNVACYWQEDGTLVTIGQTGIISTATAANYDGSIIVGRANIGPSSATAAFVWTAATGMQTLASILTAQGVSLSHWKSSQLTEVMAISDDGQYLVGNATTTGNKNEGFLVQLQPSPPPTPGVISAGTNLTISWPATGTYTLLQTTNLVSGPWTTNTSYTTSNGTNTLTIPSAGGNLFFRLRNP
jgi:probable HAF family extracellular repeat protein